MIPLCLKPKKFGKKKAFERPKTITSSAESLFMVMP